MVNLEGLVGDVELLEANRENTLIDYVDRKNISYISQWFPNDAIDESTGYPKENHVPGSLTDLRTRLIYQDTGRFKLVEVIPAGTRRLRHYSIYIYRVIKTGEYWRNRVGGRRPAIRSDFAVYLLDDSPVYAKEPCVPEDVEARFFLHVDPINPDDLPGPRRRYGSAKECGPAPRARPRRRAAYSTPKGRTGPFTIGSQRPFRGAVIAGRAVERRERT